jgi:hypothetical protein
MRSVLAVVTRPAVFSPVALFAYRRPVHLDRTLKALQANPEVSQTELFVFCDGAKDASVASDVLSVRDIVRGDLSFAAVHIVCRDGNIGLARNITEGVSHVLARHETVIVVEDDVVVSPFFLQFMNDALRCYRDKPRVGSVSGYSYPVSGPMPETYFIRGADCWGWATWRDRWQNYNPDGRELLAELKARSLIHAFDFDGVAGFSQMLEDQIAGKNNSWAILWHATCYLNDRLVLYPSRALAQNIGLEGSGTHCSTKDKIMEVSLSATPIAVGGIAVEESALAREAIRQFFLKSSTTASSERTGMQTSVQTATVRGRSGSRYLALRILPDLLIAVLRQLRKALRGEATE